MEIQKDQDTLYYYFNQGPGQIQECYILLPAKLEQLEIILRSRRTSRGSRCRKFTHCQHLKTLKKPKTQLIYCFTVRDFKMSTRHFFSEATEVSEGSSCFLGHPERSGLSLHISVHIHIHHSCLEPGAEGVLKYIKLPRMITQVQ